MENDPNNTKTEEKWIPESEILSKIVDLDLKENGVPAKDRGQYLVEITNLFRKCWKGIGGRAS